MSEYSQQHKNDLKPAMNISKRNTKCAYAEKKNIFYSLPETKYSTNNLLQSQLDVFVYAYDGISF